MQTFAGTILVLSVITVILVQSRMPTRVGKKTNFMSSLTLGLWRDRFKYLSEPQAFILRIFRGCISNTQAWKGRQGDRERELTASWERTRMGTRHFIGLLGASLLWRTAGACPQRAHLSCNQGLEGISGGRTQPTGRQLWVSLVPRLGRDRPKWPLASLILL